MFKKIPTPCRSTFMNSGQDNCANYILWVCWAYGEEPVILKWVSINSPCIKLCIFPRLPYIYIYRWYIFFLLKDINKILISSCGNIGQKSLSCFCWIEISIEHLKTVPTLFFSVFNKVTKWLRFKIMTRTDLFIFCVKVFSYSMSKCDI